MPSNESKECGSVKDAVKDIREAKKFLDACIGKSDMVIKAQNEFRRDRKVKLSRLPWKKQHAIIRSTRDERIVVEFYENGNEFDRNSYDSMVKLAKEDYKVVQSAGEAIYLTPTKEGAPAEDRITLFKRSFNVPFGVDAKLVEKIVDKVYRG